MVEKEIIDSNDDGSTWESVMKKTNDLYRRIWGNTKLGGGEDGEG